jgi:hypothetical protein
MTMMHRTAAAGSLFVPARRNLARQYGRHWAAAKLALFAAAAVLVTMAFMAGR